MSLVQCAREDDSRESQTASDRQDGISLACRPPASILRGEAVCCCLGTGSPQPADVSARE